MNSSPKKKFDYYDILNIEKSANQSQIKHAYRKLAIKYHPDKNAGNDEAVEMFKKISTAYAVLSDPVKKRQYDMYGDEEGHNAPFKDTINMDNIGTMGRLFGALADKAGISIPTEISSKVLAEAKHIASGMTHVPGMEMQSVIVDLQWGQVISDTVYKQCGKFYWLTVSEADLINGIVIHVVSTGSDKFRILLFDSDGNVSMIQESMTKKSKSEGDLFIVPYPRYGLSEIMPAFKTSRLDADIPDAFMMLDTFELDIKSLRPNKHLICVYGDNWLQSARFSIQCLVLISPNDPIVEEIKGIEKELKEKKDKLSELQPEFCELKKKFETAKKTLEENVSSTHDLISKREAAYGKYVTTSHRNYGIDILRNTDKDEKGGFLGGFTNLLKFK